MYVYNMFEIQYNSFGLSVALLQQEGGETAVVDAESQLWLYHSTKY